METKLNISSDAKALLDQLKCSFKTLYDIADEQTLKAANDFAEAYKTCLNQGKTERLFVDYAIRQLTADGFKPLSEVEVLQPGDRVYQSIKGKGLVAAVIGKQPASEGYNLLGAHIDSPRIDLKPLPIYEDGEMALLKTHYYGGIKRYQWTTIPLAMHGVVMTQSGERVEIHLGDEPGDPVVTIPEVLIHLSQEQLTRVGNQIVKGEELNVLIGSKPYGDAEVSQRFKLNILKWLNDKYGLVEKDLCAAEIEIVPAGEAKDVGFDRSFIGAYGHDDRVCAFPSLRAVMSTKQPHKTVICLLSDKEEIGSDGNTGAQSRIYENVLAELYAKQSGSFNDLAFRRFIENCVMLSADVTNGFDPTYASVSDKLNSAFMGKGICLNKYTGSGGKYDASDANAEFMAKVIRTFEAAGIPWQTGEMGHVDIGGGGTICKYMANLGMEALDCGVPVLSMHSPFEIAHKLDLYYTYLAYKCFIEMM